MSVPSKGGASLRNQYYLHLEIGLLLSLALLVVAFQVDLSTSQEFHVQMNEQETVSMRQVQQTTQETEPPPPPRPPVPVEVPNTQVVGQQDVDFDASLDMDEALDTAQKPSEPSTEEKQKEEKQEREIFIAVEESPKLIGGMAALQKAVEYPKMAKKAGLEGRVIVQFVVDENGNVQTPKVIRGVHRLLNNAAIKAVRKQKFKPGKQRGRPVKVQMALPVSFTLREGEKKQ
ncbi:MAG: energy transducer TonB [Salinibacter sp.]